MDIFNIIQLISGLTFFLFGMKVMSGNLEKLAGGRLESTLKKITEKPLQSIVFGALATIALQSSSGVTVMLVGLVNSGIMSFAQTVYIIFGANIGTTLTAWILSLSGIGGDSFLFSMVKPQNFAPLLAFVGIVFLMFSKNDKRKSLGTVFVGFSTLISGMKFMSDAITPITEIEGFENILIKFANPFFGALIGTLVTAFIQSSAACVGMLQALALTGKITVGTSIPIVMGQNIGTCISAVISTIGANSKAKRVAFVHTAVNVIGTVIFLTVYCIVDSAISPSLFAASASAWTIAAVHSVFNVAMTLILAPFGKLLIKMTQKCIPDKLDESGKEVHMFTIDERLLKTPSLVVSECNYHSIKMAESAKKILFSAFTILFEYDKNIEREIMSLEDKLDAYEDDIGTYLVKISPISLSEKDSQTTGRMLHAIGNFERLGDHAVNLLETSREIKDKKIVFSRDAYEELNVVSKALNEIINITADCYIQNNTDLAAQVEPLEQVIDSLIETIKNRHIDRLKLRECTIELGFVFSDILNNFERISDHCSNIAVAVISAENNTFNTHSYLNGVKYANNDFNKIYEKFSEKYRLA